MHKRRLCHADPFRPSRPLSCRKRRLCQGQARPGRSAYLDIRRLASGQKILRAMDGNTSGGGFEQKYPKQKKDTGTRLRFVPASLCCAPRFFPFSDRRRERFSTAPCSGSDQRPCPCATDIFPVYDRRVFRFAPEPSSFCTQVFPVLPLSLLRSAPEPSPFGVSMFPVFRYRRERFLIGSFRVFPTALPFCVVRFSVFIRPRWRFSLAGSAFYKSPGLSGQDGNCLTPIHILPKGCALWTPRQGCSAQASRIPKEKT